MIIILCDSYQDAKDAYDIFMDYLEHYEPWEIRVIYKNCLCVETWDDLRYLFIYYRCLELLSPEDKDDVLYVDHFFEGLPGFYEE